ncbi:MAG TPA: hypothetical protein PKZ84_20500 [Anaerolineae bacterium]|nr:hypothetical protein [Anaerolineae bacterium]HQI85659.1 hypothetical protein [Anaerolineae bacterium]
MMKRIWRMMVIVALLLAGVSVRPVGAGEALPPPHIGYGMMLAYPPGSLAKVKEAGFDWFKYFAYWDDIDPNHNGAYNWTGVDTQLGWACTNGLNMLLRVERDDVNWTPIQDSELAGWQALFQALAARIAQKRAACKIPYRVALEIWNEPNLDFQWTGQPLDPARYTEMVKRAYLGAKAGDPTIPIVAGSLAPTGGDGVHSINDVTFLEAMYVSGLAGHFDAISIHNYGFGGAPEDKEYGWNILNFRRAEDIYAVMVAHGDGDKQVWGTEFGWLLDATAEGHPECLSYWNDIGFLWQKVSAEQQADYLQRAFAYADANWPWMGVMIVSNLDFSVTSWYAPCDPLNWFSVLRKDTSPRLSYTALQTMEKRPRSWVASGMVVEPAAFNWSVRLRERAIFTETVTVSSTAVPFAWNVVTTTVGLPFTITPTLGVSGEPFQVTVDARELLTGTYTGVITVTSADALVTPPVIAVPLTLEIWSAWGMDVRPASLSWMMAVTDTRPVSATVVVENTGDFEFDWTVAKASDTLTMTVIPTSSTQTGTTFIPGAFRVFVDPRGLPVGLYTGTVTVTASEAAVPESPFVVPVSVRIVERLYNVYMPLVLRRY